MQDQRDTEEPASRWSRASVWLTASHWRGRTWRDLVPARARSRRFEPGPLGLLGVMLAAMAVTLLIIQQATGGFGEGEEEAGDQPEAVPGPPEGELRVMPVGDGLTQGSSGDHTWRYHLWSHLDGADVDFAFVGPHDDMYSLEEDGHGDHSYAEPDFDTAHAARWGRTVDDIADGIAEEAAEHEPHYLLILAGSDDLVSGGDPDLVLEGIGETVSTARVALEDARFVIGELPRVEGTGEDAAVNERIDRFNMGLVDLAEQLSSGESPVVVAQVSEGYEPEFDNWDEAHPNVRGEVKIAAAFADALADPLEVGEPFPRPLPELPAGPSTPPDPEAEEAGDGLRISWDQVSGATDYRVEQRRTEPEPDEATVLPLDVERDGARRSVLVESLLSGAGYEFVVHPYKGRDAGAGSDPLEVVYDDEPPPGPDTLSVREDGTVVWDEVGSASHYEVWVRPLDCSASDDSRRPLPTRTPGPESVRAPADERDQDHEAPASPPPESPSPPPSVPPVPDESPDPPGVAAEPACEPRDGQAPDGGDGWQGQGSVGSDPLWGPTVSGPHEVVVRSHRDYVPGGYSDPVLLES
ncbi:SGNH/GDSL hydrolase family protein [Nocardiopsis salina]|uniref:hypothetical protein n=1 Tax=Nocardiopsis salina TaxID=245836 RepID=UPI000345FE15|nr:hypothetical protein [Nocardiopsis salina]